MMLLTFRIFIALQISSILDTLFILIDVRMQTVLNFERFSKGMTIDSTSRDLQQITSEHKRMVNRLSIPSLYSTKDGQLGYFLHRSILKYLQSSAPIAEPHSGTSTRIWYYEIFYSHLLEGKRVGGVREEKCLHVVI
jgi:hypothetical protein